MPNQPAKQPAQQSNASGANNDRWYKADGGFEPAQTYGQGQGQIGQKQGAANLMLPQNETPGWSGYGESYGTTDDPWGRTMAWDDDDGTRVSVYYDPRNPIGPLPSYDRFRDFGLDQFYGTGNPYADDVTAASRLYDPEVFSQMYANNLAQLRNESSMARDANAQRFGASGMAGSGFEAAQLGTLNAQAALNAGMIYNDVESQRMQQMAMQQQAVRQAQMDADRWTTDLQNYASQRVADIVGEAEASMTRPGLVVPLFKSFVEGGISRIIANGGGINEINAFMADAMANYGIATDGAGIAYREKG